MNVTPIASILRPDSACTCGQKHTTITEAVFTRAGALTNLPDFLKHLGVESILCIYDANTYAAAGKGIERVLSAAPALKRTDLVLNGTPHADDSTVKSITEEMIKTRAACAAAVGSGTISDLVKVAAFTCRIPYVSIATAASMDGYLSANATIITNGNKVPFSNINPPRAVFADADILRTAPSRMTLAGFGDALGKITSLADWKLNHLLRGETYCNNTATMLRGEVAMLLDNASQAAGNVSDERFSEQLVRVLMLTGIAMQRMGNSTPASGGEHCISHAMEMKGYAERHEAPSLHGLQVAYGLAAASAAYASFFDASRALSFSADRAAARLESHRADWRALKISMGDIISKKKDLYMKYSSAFASIRTRNSDEDFSFLLRNNKRLGDIIGMFDLPKRASQVPLSDSDASFAVTHAIDVRPRFNAIDLVTAAGIADDYIFL